MAKEPHAPLSSSQREIMEIVWNSGEISAFEVREILAQRREVARETVRTLLARMEDKGWLKHRTVGRTFFYSATIPREANVGQQVLELIDTLCGGSADQLMSALMDHRGLSDEETERIQTMLRDARTAKRRER